MNQILQDIINSGLPQETVVLLLLVPVIACLVAIFRHVIGLSTSGFYFSMLFALSMYFIGDEGFKGILYGVPAIAAVLVLAYLFRAITKSWRVHYLPRMALLVSAISIIALITVSALSYFSAGEIAFHRVFPLLVIIILSERFASMLIRKNEQTVAIRMAEATLFGVLAYLVLASDFVENLVLNNPEVILIVLLINILVATSSQLRLSEFIRFRQIIKEYNRNLENK